MKNTLITPSIMTCDVLDMRGEIKKLLDAGINHLHFDFMDGHYVNNLGLSTENLFAIKKEFPQLVIDAHCMINEIYDLLETMKMADYITFHLDSKQSYSHKDLIKKIKSLNCKVGVGIDLDTDLKKLDSIIGEIDLITIMSIKPGFAGQSFQAKTWETIKTIKEKIKSTTIKTQIDGGVRWENIFDLIKHEIDFIVVGSLLFKENNYKEVLKKFMKIITKEGKETIMKIVAVCGTGLGSSFLIEMNINEVCKKLGIEAEVSHINLGSFDPSAADIVVCGLDLADSIEFENKIILQNIIDKDETESKLKEYFEK